MHVCVLLHDIVVALHYVCSLVYSVVYYVTLKYLIIMEVGRFFVRTNLTNRVKNSQWTFTKVPSTIRWVTSKGFLSVCLQNEGF